MAFLYSKDFVSYTPAATTSHANYPVARVALLADHPYLRQWRSTAVTLTDLTLDMGSDTSISGIVLLNANMATCEIATATAAAYSSFTNLGQTTYQIAQNRPTPYYNLCVMETITTRYIRIRFPASTPRHVSSHGYYAVGLALILTDVKEMGPPRVGMRETLEARYVESGANVALIGEQWTEEQWDLILTPDQLAAGHTLLELGKHTDVLWYRNRDNRAETKLMRWTGDVTLEHAGSHYLTNPEWREHV